MEAYAILAGVPAAVIIATFFSLDKNPEPVKMLVRAFFWGCMSVVMLVIVNVFIPIVEPEMDGSFAHSLEIAFFHAGFEEELAKYLVFLGVMLFRKELDEWYDGILYGVIIGTGFAFIENIDYFERYLLISGLDLVVGRSLYAMPLHALCGGIMGFFLAKFKFHLPPHTRVRALVLALMVPVVLHGLYDFVLMFYQLNMEWAVTPMLIGMWIYVMRLKRVSQMARTA